MVLQCVEIRVWKRYPGQFPGQPAAENRSIYMMVDSDGRLTALVTRIDRCAGKIRALRENRKTSRSLKIAWIRWVGTLSTQKLILLLRKRIPSVRMVAVNDYDNSAELLEEYERRHLVEDINGATKIDFFGIEAEKLEGSTTAKYVNSCALVHR